MSLKILKAGILDTVQDRGRFGYQHLGINPGGPMDLFAMQTANLLVGNKINEAVLEIFYPAPEIMFKKNTLLTSEFSLNDILENTINSVNANLLNTYDDHIAELFKNAPSLFKVKCIISF